MAGQLSQSPADVIRRLIVRFGLGVMPDGASQWQVGCGKELGFPDETITTYDTAGKDHGSTGPDGELQEHYGVSIRVRSANPQEGYAKASYLSKVLHEGVRNLVFVVGASAYLIDSVTRVGTINNLSGGPDFRQAKDEKLFTESGMTSRLAVHTMNFLVALDELSPEEFARRFGTGGGKTGTGTGGHVIYDFGDDPHEIEFTEA